MIYDMLFGQNNEKTLLEISILTYTFCEILLPASETMGCATGCILAISTRTHIQKREQGSKRLTRKATPVKSASLSASLSKPPALRQAPNDTKKENKRIGTSECTAPCICHASRRGNSVFENKNTNRA